MPFVDPEVIKLDLRLVQDNPSPAIAAIVHAVNAESRALRRGPARRGHRDRRSSATSPWRWAPATARAGSSAAPGRSPRPRPPAVFAPRRGRPGRRASPYDAVAAHVAPAPRHQAAPARDLQAPRGPGRRPGRGRRRVRRLPGGPPLHPEDRRPLRAARLPRGAGRRARRRPLRRARPGRPRRLPRRLRHRSRASGTSSSSPRTSPPPSSPATSGTVRTTTWPAASTSV